MSDLKQAAERKAFEAHWKHASREPVADDEWRTRDSSDTDDGCLALHRAHGIAPNSTEQQQ